jgi:hypothetical protein
VRWRAWFLALSVLLAAGGIVPLPRVSFAGDGKDESRIKAIVMDEIRAGILQRSPDLYLKSYLPTATVFSFRTGPVDTVQYRKILADYFATVEPKTVDCQFQDLRVEGDRASMKVRFSEKGRSPDGSEYGEVFTRHFQLVRGGGVWRIETDGYNESLRQIERMHGKPTGAQ